MSNELVSLFGALGTVVPSSGISDGNGQVTATFIAGSLQGQAMITAMSGYASDSVIITVGNIVLNRHVYLPVVLKN